MFAAEMREFKAYVDQFVESTNRRFDVIEARFDAVDARLDRHNVMLKGITDDLGQLNGSHDRISAAEDAAFIAQDLGLQRTKTLSREDLLELIDPADTADIPVSDLRSFRAADLIMEARTADGEICYVAVEISYTANGSDTQRAILNAVFLTRFNGRRSFAVVCGLNQDDRIQDSFESGEVFWHQLTPEQLNAESLANALPYRDASALSALADLMYD